VWLPAAILLVGFVASVCFARPLREKDSDDTVDVETSSESSLQD
jgi:hypothetical protein